MGCLIVLLALLSPRLALVFILIFSNLIGTAFDGGWFLPLLGFFVLPWTTLAWVLTEGISPGISPMDIVFIAFAFLLDLYSYGKSQAVRGANA
jgi:hypothetical protein